MSSIVVSGGCLRRTLRRNAVVRILISRSRVRRCRLLILRISRLCILIAIASISIVLILRLILGIVLRLELGLLGIVDIRGWYDLRLLELLIIIVAGGSRCAGPICIGSDRGNGGFHCGGWVGSWSRLTGKCVTVRARVGRCLRWLLLTAAVVVRGRLGWVVVGGGG